MLPRTVADPCRLRNPFARPYHSARVFGLPHGRGVEPSQEARGEAQLPLRAPNWRKIQWSSYLLGEEVTCRSPHRIPIAGAVPCCDEDSPLRYSQP